MDAVVRLEQVDASMGPMVGGKAANLGVLTRAGLPVPAGFCVTTEAYRAVTGTLLDPVLDQLRLPFEHSGTSAGERSQLAARARHLVTTAPVPPELEQAIRAAYADLGGGPVAVRSSATAEDLDFASFAGQQDTYLNVVGEDALLGAVRRCWASLWTDRAVSYRSTAGVDDRTVTLAVVVQEMVQAASAGVLFTANPVTGTRHQTVIDASPGLGEAVVSGAVNPDHFVVDVRSRTIVDRSLGDKRVLIRSVAGGGTERLELDGSATRASVTDAQLLALAALGARVQDHYGSPQDIEWAVDDAGALWLTQSRPITTLYPLPAGTGRPGTRAFLCLTLAQGLTRPITPMGLASFRLIASSIAAASGTPPADPQAGPWAFRVAGQRVFVDFTDVLANPVGRRLVLTFFGVMEARATAVLRRLVETPDFADSTSSPVAALRRVGRVARKVKGPRRLATAVLSPERVYRDIAAEERQLRRDLELPDSAAPEQRLELAERLLAERVFWFMPTVVAYPLAGFALLGLARLLLARDLQPGELQTVLRGLPHNPTTEMDLELWRLSQRIHADTASRAALQGRTREATALFVEGRLPEVAQQGLAEFLQRYGHRAVAEIDLGMPRWSDDPAHLVGVLANYLRLDDPALAPDAQFRAGAAAAEAMVEELTARARRRGTARAAVVAYALRRTRQLAGLRESPKNLLVLALAGVRRQLRLVGEVLADQSRIAAGDDVFFLTLADVRAALAGADLSGLAAERREAYAGELRRRHIPRVLLSDGTEPEAMGGAGAAGAADGQVLVGSPASAGQVTARARVILDPVGAHLEPGEILVAPSTDPGWTPLFLTAGGLVMEMGGSNSHGAVVAREYGIPAVVGVPDATSRLRSGQVVMVDGATGQVTPEVETDQKPAMDVPVAAR